MPETAGTAPPADDTTSSPERLGSILLVASSGGHLSQLVSLSERFVPSRPARWVTFETDQSTALLRGRSVTYVPYIAPRAWRQLLRTIPAAWRELRTERPEIVVSTGAAIALAYLPLARLLRIRAHYIESATRAGGPSMTGRILRFVPGVQLHTQHAALAEGPWPFVGSVFEGFEAVARPCRPVRRAVVTLGTIEPFEFTRLVERMLAILPEHIEVVWQTGATDVANLPIEGRKSMSSTEFEEAIAAADVVVAHAGTGTALTCLQLGVRPVLVPRRAAHGEHVDDHQKETADYLARLNVAAVVEADALELHDLEAATGWQIREQAELVPIELSGHRTQGAQPT